MTVFAVLVMAVVVVGVTAAPGVNFGWSSASDGSVAAGVISNSDVGDDSFSVAHGGNSAYGDGGEGGTVTNSRALPRRGDDFNFGRASATGGSAAVGTISNSKLGRDTFSVAHGGNSQYGRGGNAGNIHNTEIRPRKRCGIVEEFLNSFIHVAGC